MEYTQCLLYRMYNTAGDCFRRVVWIPKKFAGYGKVIRLKEEDGTWSDGWIVEELYNTESKEFIENNTRNWLHFREALEI